MATVKGFLNVLFILSALLFTASPAQAILDTNRLSRQDIKLTENLLAKLSPLIQEKRAKGTLATLTFEELYAPLNTTNNNILRSFQDLDAAKLNIKLPYRGITAGKEAFVVLKGQKSKSTANMSRCRRNSLPKMSIKAIRR
jgi:hypothetical protein